MNAPPAHSFTDFLDAWGQAHPPEMVYREGEDFAEWQQRFRTRIETLRGPLPERVDPIPQVVETTEEADHTRLLLSIPVSQISTLPAYLLIPGNVAEGERRPGLIVCHGHAQYGIDSVCGVRGMETEDGVRRAYALHAVRAGYVVIAPAWWGWPGRDAHLDKVRDRDKCNVIQMAAAPYGISVLDLHIQDGQAAVDALAARPEVERERIGCIGNSYGGRMTMWLTIFEERIKACAAGGCMNNYRERSLQLASCGIQHHFGMLRYGDIPELFSLIAPRPLQLHVGEQDPLIPHRERDAMAATVRRSYQLLKAENNFSYAKHPEGHIMLWELVAPFLKRHL